MLEPRLRSLARQEILTSSLDARSPERGQYAFVQALIREVAYNTLSRRDRRDRHLAAARFFESLGSEELAGALAGHYLSAHENATEGPEADALAAQARIALRAAAERAAGLGSHAQAVSLLDQAMRVTTDPAELADTLERSAESASLMSAHDDAVARITRAEEVRAPSATGLRWPEPPRPMAGCSSTASASTRARAHLEQATRSSPTSTAPRSSP